MLRSVSQALQPVRKQFCTKKQRQGATSAYSVSRLVQGMVHCNLDDQQQETDEYGRQDDAAVAACVPLLIHEIFAAQGVSLCSESSLQATAGQCAADNRHRRGRNAGHALDLNVAAELEHLSLPL